MLLNSKQHRASKAVLQDKSHGENGKRLGNPDRAFNRIE